MVCGRGGNGTTNQAQLSSRQDQALGQAAGAFGFQGVTGKRKWRGSLMINGKRKSYSVL